MKNQHTDKKASGIGRTHRLNELAALCLRDGVQVVFIDAAQSDDNSNFWLSDDHAFPLEGKALVSQYTLRHEQTHCISRGKVDVGKAAILPRRDENNGRQRHG